MSEYPDLLELRRCRDSDDLDEIKCILEEAGIPYKVSSTAPNFEISSIGTGHDGVLIVSVPADLFESARMAMEKEYLKVDIPEDHYLPVMSDEELAEVVGKPAEWSPFDVTHARRLLLERNVSFEIVERKRSERTSELKRGKPAPRSLLILGWLFSMMGGIIGFGIGWSLCFMKERTPEGQYYTYDAKSRDYGKGMLLIGSLVVIFALLYGLLLRYPAR